MQWNGIKRNEVRARAKRKKTYGKGKKCQQRKIKVPLKRSNCCSWQITFHFSSLRWGRKERETEKKTRWGGERIDMRCLWEKPFLSSQTPRVSFTHDWTFLLLICVPFSVVYPPVSFILYGFACHSLSCLLFHLRFFLPKHPLLQRILLLFFQQSFRGERSSVIFIHLKDYCHELLLDVDLKWILTHLLSKC